MKPAPASNLDVSHEAALYRALMGQQEEYGIFCLSVDGTLTTWNPGVARILGYQPDEFVGKPYSHLFAETEHAEKSAAKELGEARRRGRVQSTCWHLRSDGSRAFVSGVTLRMLDADGQLTGYTKIFHDITSQKRAADARKRLISKLGDLAYALDLTHAMIREMDGTIARWTAGAEKLYGWTALEAERRISHELLRTEFPQPLAEIEAHLLKHGEWHGNLTHVAKSGMRLHMASHWALRRTSASDAPFVIEVNNDVTEIQRMQTELERANRALSSFSYEVAHDLQSPLRSIGMCAQLLAVSEGSAPTPEQQELVQSISDKSNRLRVLVNSLLQYASAPDAEGERKDLQLEAVLARALSNLSASISEKDAQIHWDPLPVVRVNESKLLQVLQNLIGNAIKYSRPGVAPRIHVRAEETPTEWIVHLQDNGMGIEPGAMERVFVPLQRLHGPEISGTGLGLAICRRAVEAEGGRIWLQSAVGLGSTFYFTIKR